MGNRIVDLSVSVTPGIQATVDVAVRPERDEPGLEARGRLMGPRCRFATTVEVAYHFRPTPGLGLRAVVPEACLWDPVSPHLYEGPVELWRDGHRLDARTLSLGLRTFAMGPRGLRVNGRVTPLVGRRLGRLDEGSALELRTEGVNLALLPADAAEESWDVADRVGLIVLVVDVAERTGHPSSLGWEAFTLRDGRLMAGDVELGRVD